MDELLDNEKKLKELVPHPLSFIKYHMLWLIPLVWGAVLLYMYGSFNNSSIDMVKGVTIWLAGIIFLGVIFSFLLIRWRILILYATISAIAIGIMWNYNLWSNYRWFIPAYTILIFLAGLPIVEIYRKSHRYIITNFRLITRGGIVVKNERSVRYDKIADISSRQGVIGRIFDFGDIIPITQSGFGLGEDEAILGGGAGGEKKIKLFGFAAAGRNVSEPRARSYYEMHGVHPFKEVKRLFEGLVQENTLAPYARQQVELQKKMLDLMKEKKDKED